MCFILKTTFLGDTVNLFSFYFFLQKNYCSYCFNLSLWSMPIIIFDTHKKYTQMYTRCKINVFKFYKILHCDMDCCWRRLAFHIYIIIIFFIKTRLYCTCSQVGISSVHLKCSKSTSSVWDHSQDPAALTLHSLHTQMFTFEKRVITCFVNCVLSSDGCLP